jgi:putative transposase
VDISLPASRIVETLDTLLLVRGRLGAIVCDNGPEFVSLALDQWATRHGVRHAFIRPGRPVEN